MKESFTLLSVFKYLKREDFTVRKKEGKDRRNYGK